MAKVIGVFGRRRQAEEAAYRLRSLGFSGEISILGKEQETEEDDDTTMTGGSSDSITDGSATGGVIGGLAGLAAGAGALVIPGIGPLLAAGPIAGAFTGAITGGLAGGLVDWGIPAGDSRRYEDEIKQGSVLVSVECSGEKAEKAMESLRRSGAKEVKKH